MLCICPDDWLSFIEKLDKTYLIIINFFINCRINNELFPNKSINETL